MGFMVSEDVVWEKLKTVPDPEMGISVVDLGLIYKVEIDGGLVKILMTLTSPACPMADMFDELVGGAVRQLDGVDRVEVDLTFDPPWTMEMVSEFGKAELGFF